MNAYLAQCVDEFTDPTLPVGMTAAEAVTELEQIREQHRDAATTAKKYIDRSGANAEAREVQQEVYDRHRERAAHATALIRRFRTEAQRGNVPPEKWAVMNRAERRAAARGDR